MALPLLLLAAFVFVAGFEWGNLLLQLVPGCIWMDLVGPVGVLVSNRGRIGRWILFIFQRFSCYRSPLAEISLQKSVSWDKQV